MRNKAMHPSEFITVAEAGLSKLRQPGTMTEHERTALRTRYGFLLSSVYGRGDPDLDLSREELCRRAELTDAVIQKVEAGVADLEVCIRESGPDIPAPILSPFNRIKRNTKNNPLRNKYRMKLALLEKTFSQFAISENSFFYALHGETRKNSVAAFRGYDRTMFVPEKFDPENSYDALLVCHETVHVSIDDAQREHIRTVDDARRYLEGHEFFAEAPGKPKRMLLNEELVSYGLELQIANLALGGALESGAGISAEEISTRLKARPEQCPGIDLLFDLAEKFFPEGKSHTPNQPYPPAFATAIIDLHKGHGYEVWSIDPLGRYSRIA